MHRRYCREGQGSLVKKSSSEGPIPTSIPMCPSCHQVPITQPDSCSPPPVYTVLYRKEASRSYLGDEVRILETG